MTSAGSTTLLCRPRTERVPDPKWLQIASRPILKPVSGIAGQERLVVRLATVDHNPLGPAMPFENLAQESLGGREIASFTEPKLDYVAIAVDGSIEILPMPTDFDVDTV